MYIDCLAPRASAFKDHILHHGCFLETIIVDVQSYIMCYAVKGDKTLPGIFFNEKQSYIYAKDDVRQTLAI